MGSTLLARRRIDFTLTGAEQDALLQADRASPALTCRATIFGHLI